MSRFDNPLSLALLFAAATAVSMLLILLLNAEARNRKSHREPEIRNGNMFSELGNKLKNWMTVWFTDANSTAADVLILDTSSEWESGSVTRRLQWARDVAKEQHHRVRHGAQRAREAAPHIAPSRNAAVRAARTVGAADACYDTNEVLVIIGLTCVINLAFVGVVLCLVHMCGRHKARWPDSAMVLMDGGDAPFLGPVEDPTAPCCPISSYSSVYEYTNSAQESVAQHTHEGRRASTSSMEHLLFIG